MQTSLLELTDKAGLREVGLSEDEGLGTLPLCGWELKTITYLMTRLDRWGHCLAPVQDPPELSTPTGVLPAWSPPWMPYGRGWQGVGSKLAGEPGPALAPLGRARVRGSRTTFKN